MQPDRFRVEIELQRQDLMRVHQELDTLNMQAAQSAEIDETGQAFMQPEHGQVQLLNNLAQKIEEAISMILAYQTRQRIGEFMRGGERTMEIIRKGEENG